MGGNCLSCVHTCDGLSSQLTTTDCCLKWIKSGRREPEEKIGWEACSLKKYFTGGHPLKPNMLFIDPPKTTDFQWLKNVPLKAFTQ